MEQYIWKQVGSVTERSLFLGNKKRIGNAGACWESERSLLRKTKTKQMERCNPPRNKQTGERKGAEPCNTVF